MKIILGSTREHRFSEYPAAWIAEETKKLEGVEVETIDLRDFSLPFYDQPASPSTFQKGEYPNPIAKQFAQKINEADAFIVVGPEYNHGYSAVLKNAFDWVYWEWNNKPIGFVSYGSVGGARSVEQMRLVSVELQMAPIRNAVHIPGNVLFPVIFGKAEWNVESLDQSVKDNAQKMLDQLVWWARALRTARESNPPNPGK